MNNKYKQYDMEKNLMYSNTKGNKTPQHLWHRLLLVLITMLTGITGAWATGSNLIFYQSNGIQKLIVVTNDDPDLSSRNNYVNYDNGQGDVSSQYDVVTWGYSQVEVQGAISQTGLNVIQSNATNSSMKFDMTQASVSGTWTAFPAKASSVLLPNDTSIPDITWGSNTQYVFSEASSTANDYYLYVASGVSVSTITELNTSNLTGNKVLHISGPGAKALKTELLASPYSVNSANIDVPFDGSITVTSVSAGGLQTAAEAALTAEGGTASSQITNLTISGTLNDTDLTYIAGLTNLTTLDLSGVTSTVSTLSSNSLVNLTLPSNATALPTNLATNCPNVESAYVYSYTTNNLSMLDAYVKSAGNLTSLVNELKGRTVGSNGSFQWISGNATIKISGSLNSTDVALINEQFQNSNVVDFSDATGITASTLSGYHQVVKLPDGSDMPTDVQAEAWVNNNSNLIVYSLSQNGKTISIWARNDANVITNAITGSKAIGGYSGIDYAKIVGKAGIDFTTAETALINNNINIARDPISYNGCEVTINRDFSSETMANLISTAKTTLGQTQICTLTVSGAMSAADVTALNTAMGANGDLAAITRLNLGEATGVTQTQVDNLQLSSSLTSLVLPKDKTVSTALSGRMTAITGLMYAYSPSSDAQRLGASSTGSYDEAKNKIADYVWVVKAGGLAQAFTNEEWLRNSFYIKVASYVALNNTDVDFNDLDTYKPTNYLFLDFSGANLTPAVAAGYVVTDDLPYRIILPDDWTGDQMAVFSNNPNKGSLAAVYSYTGTTLKILEIDDKSYMTGALNNPRIVKSGTDAIEVVAKRTSEENAHYGEFGDHLISAINGAASSIKTVNLNLGRGVNTNDRQPIVLTNKNITTLTMQNVASLYSPTLGFSLNVSGCTALTTLDLTGSVLGALDAHNLTNLTTVNLNGTMIYDTNGSADLSGSGVTTTGFQTNGSTEFLGTLNLAKTALTSFSTPAKVTGDIYLNATTPLTSLDLTSTQFQNNSSLIHVHATDDETDTNPISSLNNGSYKTITVPNGFDKTRIHPNDNNVLDDNILEEEPTVVANEYTATATDMTFHEKEAGDGTDHYRYWYQGSSADDDGIITLGTSSTSLATIISGHSDLTSDTHAKIRIVGPLTSADVDALASLNCTALDLSNATSGVDGTTIGELLKAKFQTTDAVHSNTRFIALPDTCSRDFILNATALEGLKSSVYCVIAVNDVSNGKDLTSYSFQSGSLQPAVAIFQNSSAQSWTTIKTGYTNTRPKYASTVSDFKKLKIGGLINSYDLAGPAQGINLNNDGHLVFAEDADENNYAQKRTMNGGNTIYGPFSASFLITEIDLRDAYLEEYGNNQELPGEQYYRYWGEDITLSALGVISTATYKVVIPQDKRVHELPADFMNCSTNIRAICIPSNIQAIRTRAFWTIDYVWTTADAFVGGHDPEGENTRLDNGAKLRDGTQVNALLYNTTTLKYEENPAFLDSYYTADYSGVNGGGSYTFGSTLKMIESGAFANTQPNVRDVYVLNINAPECHVDAFNTVMYTGNGGYNPTEVTNEGIITREAYFNGRWITMLHYPRQTTDPNIQRYTDPTREYSIATGERDGKGAIIYFPNQSEFIRAYQQGTFGYTWRAWNPAREYGSVNNGNMTNTTAGWTAEGQTGANALFNAYASGTDHQYRSFYDVSSYTGVTAPTATIVPYYNVNWNGSAYSTVTPQANLYPISEKKADNDADNSGEKTPKDYRGWHQFVLTAYAANTVLEEEPYRSYITDNEWWTICPEFDITRNQAVMLFGCPTTWNPSGQEKAPYVSKLRYVRRTYGSDGNNVIHLNFSHNLMVYKEARAAAEAGSLPEGLTANQHGSLDENGIMVIGSGIENGTPSGGDVVMSAGVPYLIKPNMVAIGGSLNRQFRVVPSTVWNNLTEEQKAGNNPRYIGDDDLYEKIKKSQELSGSEQRAIIKSGTYTVPVFLSGKTDAVANGYVYDNVEQDVGGDKNYTIADSPYNKSTDRHYTFVGTFYKSFLPHYSYFLGWDSQNNCARFYYHNGNFETIDHEMRWANATGVIVPTLADDLEGEPLAFKYSVTQASDMEHPAQWDLLTTFLDDSFKTSGGNGAKQYVMEFDSPDVKYSDNIDTGIENIEANKESGANISAAQGVYTLDGRKVSDSLQGLPKGIYVVNGKKFVVK